MASPLEKVIDRLTVEMEKKEAKIEGLRELWRASKDEREEAKLLKEIDALETDKKQLMDQRSGLLNALALAAAPQAGGSASEMEENIKAIKRIVTEGSESTRHASTITAQDLDKVEASLDMCFVPVEDDPIDPETNSALQDDTEFKWEENKHEAKHRDAYIQAMQSKMNLPAHLRWSLRTDTRVLSTTMYSGGAELPFSIGCRTDAMVVASRSLAFEDASIVATVELKKKVVKQSLRQTKATFVCASLKSQLPVISCVTDMEKTAVAYYTAGQQRGSNGATICKEHIFSSPEAMLRWLGRALSAESVSSEVLRLVGDEVKIPDTLPNPKRVRLPVPKPMRGRIADVHTIMARLLGEDNDIACLRDVESMCEDQARTCSYFS